jgi:peptide/nickel transport system permease protein
VLTYLGRRVAGGVVVLLGVSLLVFGLVYLTGDPARAQLPANTPQAVVDAFRQQHGLDRPIPVQYLDFLAHAVQGDFGTSLRYGQPALGVVLERLPATLALGGLGVLVALLIAVPLGIAAARRQGGKVDRIARGVALTGQAVPSFILAPLLIAVFAVTLHWLPVSGSSGPAYLVLPALTIGLAASAGLIRILRSSLLEVYGRDHIRTARAKGLDEDAVMRRHALRLAVIPVVTFLAFDVAAILSGVVVVEVIFAWPGMGRLAYTAISGRDIPVIQAFVFIAAVVIVGVNLLLDVVYGVLDPRIRPA